MSLIRMELPRCSGCLSTNTIEQESKERVYSTKHYYYWDIAKISKCQRVPVTGHFQSSKSWDLLSRGSYTHLYHSRSQGYLHTEDLRDRGSLLQGYSDQIRKRLPPGAPVGSLEFDLGSILLLPSGDFGCPSPVNPSRRQVKGPSTTVEPSLRSREGAVPDRGCTASERVLYTSHKK